MNNEKNSDSLSKAYQDAGVSITFNQVQDDINALSEDMKSLRSEEVLSDTSGFSGLFELNTKKYKNPVLVSGMDGVGTKLKIAIEAKRHDSIGVDLVAMSVNDILTSGAEPLFFLDYISSSDYNQDRFKQILKGIIKGCKQSNMALIGGETAQMPGFYKNEDYDICGTAIGVVEKSKRITGENIEKGDLLFGLPSSGFHSNGFSLIQKVLFKENSFSLREWIPELSCFLEDLLLQETFIYAKIIKSILSQIEVRGIAHITGGGLYENIQRILPANRKLGNLTFEWAKSFRWFQSLAKLSDNEMLSIFNCGIGMVLCISKRDKEKFLTIFQDNKNMNPLFLGFIL